MQISLFAHLGEGAPIILGDRPDHIGLKRNMGAKFEIYIGPQN